ncbi:MAG: hypothetical protein AAFX87_13475 [Bacteroidota bacterium]
MKPAKLFRIGFTLCLSIFVMYSSDLYAQDQELRIKIEPENISIGLKDKAQIKATVVNDKDQAIAGRRVRFFTRDAKIAEVDSVGNIIPHAPGTCRIIVISPNASGNFLREDITINIKYPPLAKVEIQEMPEEIYAGTTIKLKANVYDQEGFKREDARLEYTSSNSQVITADVFGNFKAVKTGKAAIIAKVEGIEGRVNIKVIDNPVVKMELTSNTSEARTGDVIRFSAKAMDKKGNEVKDAPLAFAFQGEAYNVSQNASGLIKQDGRFVADEAGLYSITVSSGPFSASKTVNISPRDVKRKINLTGHGSVNDKHTSDFWIWEGVDGRDYGVTGTWGADGTAYFWDVTDPSNIIKIDSVQVDARTVNDVKISEDGKTCIISREGASSRKNGIVIIDVTNPRDANVIATFTENLTGGVHNLFIYEDHVYALSAGQKYYIINIKDRTKPYIVSKFELDTPGHAIHDVWVQDGIAYSSNWADGIQLVDVGNGIAGGSPENPVQFASYAYPNKASHAAFPFKSKSTGKFYVIGGDEIFPYGLDLKGENIAGGYLHFVDFSNLENPDEIARFELPMAGSHNYWVDEETETLYVAFYNGGVRVVDISGELMGDLYRQGREIAWIIPSDPNGYVPNAPFTWGAQLHKGHIFYSDWNSGLWSAKLEPIKPKDTKVESK